MIETAAIVGVGLIGGSFGLALRAAGFRGGILGVSSPPAIEAARARGAIDRGASLEEAARAADLIYLAQPISRILETLERLGPLVRPDALVTDAGSTKRAIVTKARECLGPASFLGGHPMAGKEARGAEAASADLFARRPYLLVTPERKTAAMDEFVSWVEAAGALPRWMSAEEHDRLVAASSHVPQLVSTALASSLGGRADASEVAAAAGPGLRDMTRLAMSSYEIWRDILATNSDEIAAALDGVQEELARIRTALEGGPMQERFENASRFAARMRRPAQD